MLGLWSHICLVIHDRSVYIWCVDTLEHLICYSTRHTYIHHQWFTYSTGAKQYIVTHIMYIVLLLASLQWYTWHCTYAYTWLMLYGADTHSAAGRTWGDVLNCCSLFSFGKCSDKCTISTHRWNPASSTRTVRILQWRGSVNLKVAIPTNILGWLVEPLGELHVVQETVLVGVGTIHEIGYLIPENGTRNMVCVRIIYATYITYLVLRKPSLASLLSSAIPILSF